MPIKSEAQRRLMHAAAARTKKGAALRKRLGMSPSTAEHYVASDPGGRLPAHAGRKRGKKK